MRKQKKIIVSLFLSVIFFLIIKYVLGTFELVKKIDFFNQLIGNNLRYLDIIENIISAVASSIIWIAKSISRIVVTQAEVNSLKKNKACLHIHLICNTRVRKNINYMYQPVIELIRKDRKQFVYLKCNIKNIGENSIVNFKINEEIFELTPFLEKGDQVQYYFRISVPFFVKFFLLKYEDENGKQFRQVYYIILKAGKIKLKRWRLVK